MILFTSLPYIGYWESLLQQLNAYMARARLKEQHQEKLKRKLASLRQQVRGVTLLEESLALILID